MSIDGFAMQKLVKGDIMIQKYRDLNELIHQNQQAQQFYSSLPDYVQDMIAQRASSVNSLESLQCYADNLLQGDK